MTAPLALVVAPFVLMVLLYAERKEKLRIKVGAKSLLSVLFVVVALSQPAGNGTFFGLLLTGLLFSVIGDICLALPQKRAFLAGLIAFLLGHLFYIFAFAAVADWGGWLLGTTLATAGISGAAYSWLWPHLGKMKVPVAAYVVVITLMVGAAGAVVGTPSLSMLERFAVFLGATAFFFSDLFVARHRFVHQTFANRAAGLPLYYVGQFLLALSISLEHLPE